MRAYCFTYQEEKVVILVCEKDRKFAAKVKSMLESAFINFEEYDSYKCAFDSYKKDAAKYKTLVVDIEDIKNNFEAVRQFLRYNENIQIIAFTNIPDEQMIEITKKISFHAYFEKNDFENAEFIDIIKNIYGECRTSKEMFDINIIKRIIRGAIIKHARTINSNFDLFSDKFNVEIKNLIEKSIEGAISEPEFNIEDSVKIKNSNDNFNPLDSIKKIIYGFEDKIKKVSISQNIDNCEAQNISFDRCRFESAISSLIKYVYATRESDKINFFYKNMVIEDKNYVSASFEYHGFLINNEEILKNMIMANKDKAYELFMSYANFVYASEMINLFSIDKLSASSEQGYIKIRFSFNINMSRAECKAGCDSLCVMNKTASHKIVLYDNSLEGVEIFSKFLTEKGHDVSCVTEIEDAFNSIDDGCDHLIINVKNADMGDIASLMNKIKLKDEKLSVIVLAKKDCDIKIIKKLKDLGIDCFKQTPLKNNDSKDLFNGISDFEIPVEVFEKKNKELMDLAQKSQIRDINFFVKEYYNFFFKANMSLAAKDDASLVNLIKRFSALALKHGVNNISSLMEDMRLDIEKGKHKEANQKLYTINFEFEELKKKICFNCD